jgi:uncharacterized protein (TIGR02147 family)
VKDQIAVQNLLRRKLFELQTRNRAFSVRAFATRLGIQPSAANEILKGERRISRKMAERLAARLHLDPSERAELLGHFEARARRAKRLPESRHLSARLGDRPETLRLTTDQFSAISDWTHFAILNLVKTVGCRNESEWMAERLGITPSRAAESLGRLERLGLIERGPDGRWKRTYARINTTDDVLSVSVQKSHLADMDLAREALLREPIERRDFTSMTLALSPAILPQAKEILRRAQDEIAALADSRPADEVYRLTSYLFPLTRSPESRSKPTSPKKKESP